MSRVTNTSHHPANKDGNESPIEVDITSPADGDKTGDPAAHYVPINHTLDLTCEAEDTDSYCKPKSKGGDGIWYDYSDDVTSGTTMADAHMWWYVASGDGGFIYESGPPIVNHKYGTSATYTAPGYSAGNNLRTATLNVIATDMQLGGDTLGDPDDLPDTDSIDVKVWQVTVTVQQDGTTSGNYDGTAVPAVYGGTDLGWVTPENAAQYAAGVRHHAGNTQTKGSIPAGPDVTTGYQWRNAKKGLKRHKAGADWVNDYSQATWELDFDHTYGYVDQDSRHNGSDVREIFAMDAPGYLSNGGAANIPPWTDVNFNMNYRAEVRLDGIRISKQKEWGVEFTLDVNGGKWHTVSHSP